MATHFSLQNLAAFHPVQIPHVQSPPELLSQSTSVVSTLLTQLWSLPTVKGDDNSGPLALLPTDNNLRNSAYVSAGGDPGVYDAETSVLVPRAKPLPAAREETRWEKFAKEKGIESKKRSRKVYDEETDDWKARYGMGSKKNDEMNYPIMEADAKDPYANPWEKLRDAKKERVEENQIRKGKNLERSGKLASGSSNKSYKESQRARSAGREGNGNRVDSVGVLPSGVLPSGVPVDFGRNGKDRGKASTEKALRLTQRSTASLGKFDDHRAGEPEKKKAVTRRKFNDNMRKGDEKKDLKILDNVISGIDPDGKGKNKNKGARGTAYDYEYNDGLGEQGFRKKKGRAGQGKMRKVTKKNIK